MRAHQWDIGTASPIKAQTAYQRLKNEAETRGERSDTAIIEPAGVNRRKKPLGTRWIRSASGR